MILQMDETATFQVVLICDHMRYRCYILFNYYDIRWHSGFSSTIGFTAPGRGFYFNHFATNKAIVADLPRIIGNTSEWLSIVQAIPRRVPHYISPGYGIYCLDNLCVSVSMLLYPALCCPPRPFLYLSCFTVHLIFGHFF